MTTNTETGSAMERTLSRVLDKMRTNASIGMACGEPRTVGDTTIIPVGMVAYGYGIGMGASEDEGAGAPGEGGGGGAGGWIMPVAIVSITNGQTKVVPVLDWTRVLVGIIGVIGKLVMDRRGSR